MFTFFKRSSSSKHKREDSRSASATPPPCSRRLPSSLLTATAGGGSSSGERKAPKNKRVRFKFVSDHDEDEAKQQRVEEPVSASLSNQLHGSCSSPPQRDYYAQPFFTDYSVEEPLSPLLSRDEHVSDSFDFGERNQDHGRATTEEDEEIEEVVLPRPKARSALNQLLDRMAGKKNRHRGGSGSSGGGGNSKKPKHQNETVLGQPRHPVANTGPQNVVRDVKNCDQEEADYYNYNNSNDRDACVRREHPTNDRNRHYNRTQNLYRENSNDYEEEEDDEYVVRDDVAMGEACAADGVAEVEPAAAYFNARGDRHENRPEILHKINAQQKSNGADDDDDEQHSSRLSSHNNSQQQRSASIEKPSFRLFVNEQPAIADESPSPPSAPGNTAADSQAADFVRDLVLNRYKKKRDRPSVSSSRKGESSEIPTVIFDEHIVPVVIEKSDDEEEEFKGAGGGFRKKMGQPSSKASSPNPLEKSSSDGSIHPTVIITEEEVFYEANDETEQPLAEQEEDQIAAEEDDGILREHSPLRLSPAFKTIHVSTEDLQDEPEKPSTDAEEEEEETDSGNFNSCYNNTIRNSSGVTVVEIVDENNNDQETGNCSSSEEEDEEEDDSGCEEILGSAGASPQRRPSPIPVVAGNNNGAQNDVTSSEEEDDEEQESATEEEDDENDESGNQIIEPPSPPSIFKHRKKVNVEAECVSLPDVVESIGLPNVVHVMHSANSVKFSNQHSDPSVVVATSDKRMMNQNGSQGVLHVDGNSHKSCLVRNIPITILEETSEDDEAAEQCKVDVIKGTKGAAGAAATLNGYSNHSNPSNFHQNGLMNGNNNNNKDYKKNSGFTIEEQTRDNDFDFDKRDLVNQDALQSKGRVAELQAKLDELERNLTVKVWTIDRLEAELASAAKEGECLRRKLKHQDEQMSQSRHKFEDNEDDLNRRYQDLEERYNETLEKLTSIQSLTSHLQVQIAEAQCDAEQVRREKQQLIDARTAEEKILREVLEQAVEERAQLEAKWQREFEQLRNFNQDREEHLMEDCEWKMRSMQKQCKEKLDKAELHRKEALLRAEEMEDITKLQEERIESLKSYEGEVTALRGLTGEQRENLMHIMRQLEQVKEELNEANQQAALEIRNAQKIKTHCENEILSKERYALIRIEEAKMQISMQWERKLLEEMVRLKCELEAVHADDRKEALEKLKNEYTSEINELVKAHKSLEKELREEIDRLKEVLQHKKEELMEAQVHADKQVVDTRIYIDRSDRTNQMLLDRMERDREKDREEMEEQFCERLQSVKDEFARELVESTQEVEEKYKRLLESQIEQFVAEKEEMLQEAETRHKHKIKTMEEQMRDLEIQFQREKSDYERNHGIERSALEKREMKNSEEIDTLHRKCRCLTKLFEEMRMRYERRESRQEDVREIGELKERCESQERDLMRLTETLRQLQIIQDHQHTMQPDVQMPADVPQTPPRTKCRGLPNPSHDCDVIYEEQEPQEEEEEAEEAADDEGEPSTTIDEGESTASMSVLEAVQ